MNCKLENDFEFLQRWKKLKQKHLDNNESVPDEINGEIECLYHLIGYKLDPINYLDQQLMKR